MDGLAPNLLSG